MSETKWFVYSAVLLCFEFVFLVIGYCLLFALRQAQGGELVEP